MGAGAADIFDKTTRLVLQELGYRRQVTSARGEKVLAWKPRPLEEMVVSMGESLIKHGVVCYCVKSRIRCGLLLAATS